MKIVIIITALLLLSSCGKADKLTLSKAEYSDLKNWHRDNKTQALNQFQNTCKYLSKYKQSYDPLFSFSSIKEKCKKLEKFKGNSNDFIENNFEPYLASGNKGELGLFTGYYEISMNGSRKKTSRYKYPIYKTPSNLKKGKVTRADINNGYFSGKNLEIVYTDDPVRLYLMHVQGSGRVILDDGKIVKLKYDNQNGFKYNSIAKYLIEKKGYNPKAISTKTLVDYLNSHPSEKLDIINTDPSYIFFQEYSGEGPFGAMGAPVKKERSLAIDNSYIPYGYMIWLETKYPNNKDLNKLVIGQDKGGAIKGPVRGDVFFGSDKEGEKNAWFMNAPGKYYILIPK